MKKKSIKWKLVWSFIDLVTNELICQRKVFQQQNVSYCVNRKMKTVFKCNIFYKNLDLFVKQLKKKKNQFYIKKVEKDRKKKEEKG